MNSDLLNKINFYEIKFLQLDERSEDIEDLVKKFVKDSLNYYEMDIKKFSMIFIHFLMNLNSIKNIAQLKKFIEWSIFMFSDDNCKLLNKKCYNFN